MRMYDGKERDLYSLRYVTYIPPLVRPFTEKTQEELEEWVRTMVESLAYRVCTLAKTTKRYPQSHILAWECRCRSIGSTCKGLSLGSEL